MTAFQACQTVSGFISNDHENKVSFLSSERPLEDNVARLVDQAAVRSLSCEVVPEKEGKSGEFRLAELLNFFGWCFQVKCTLGMTDVVMF